MVNTLWEKQNYRDFSRKQSVAQDVSLPQGILDLVVANIFAVRLREPLANHSHHAGRDWSTVAETKSAMCPECEWTIGCIAVRTEIIPIKCGSILLQQMPHQLWQNLNSFHVKIVKPNVDMIVIL